MQLSAHLISKRRKALEQANKMNWRFNLVRAKPTLHRLPLRSFPPNYRRQELDQKPERCIAAVARTQQHVLTDTELSSAKTLRLTALG